MIEEVRLEVISVLKDVIVHLERRNILGLRELSDHIIHTASIYQDEYSISTAVIVFAMSKIIQRENYIDARIISILKKAVTHLQHYKVNKYTKDIHKLIALLSKTDSQLNLYIQHIIDEANVKKASKIYEHGISLGQTAQLLGISQWELMGYVGHTKIPDTFIEKVTIKKRIEHTNALFGL